MQLTIFQAEEWTVQNYLYLCPLLRGGGGGGGGNILFLVRTPLASVLASHFLVCTISCKPVVGFLPNLHGYIIETKQRTKIRFWWPWTNFQGHCSRKTEKSMTVSCLHNILNQWLESYQILRKVYRWDTTKELVRLWWPWPNFQGCLSA